MSNIQLNWQALSPQTIDYNALFKKGKKESITSFLALQPRLTATLKSFCRPNQPAKLLLLRGKEDRRYLSLLAEMVTEYSLPSAEVVGSHYEIEKDRAVCRPATQVTDNFSAIPNTIFDDWAEQEQLFGCLRHCHGEYRLQPGLVHQANGGTLLLPLSVVLIQPFLWYRLKQILLSGQFRWYSMDETRPLPLSIAPMPLNLRLILVGDHFNLAEFTDLDPDINMLSIFTEIESDLSLKSKGDIAYWIGYIHWILKRQQLPSLEEEAWPVLFQIAMRYSEDQQRLPLCPFWLGNLLAETALESHGEPLRAEHFQRVFQTRYWRESYLPELVMDDIHHGQVRIETEGKAIGQLNGLSVVSYPGHTLSFGEPSRISCVVHFGDGDVSDVERKADLGGNIHAKGMLIMQAYLASELALDQQHPFSASLVFEQSYSEVDGDSASLAGLCTLVSALAQQPLSQQIAVTGAVDQFGRVQAVGGINEKIEGFFAVCEKRGLTGGQGVIFPATNLRQLCLLEPVVHAVRTGNFHLWAVDHVADALPLLTGMPYKHAQEVSLLGLINERITQLNIAQDRQRLPFFLRWFS